MASQPIKLSDEMVVNCPQVGGKLRRAALCLSCPVYGGMAKAAINGVLVQNDDIGAYRIVCENPVMRKIEVVE